MLRVRGNSLGLINLNLNPDYKSEFGSSSTLSATGSEVHKMLFGFALLTWESSSFFWPTRDWWTEKLWASRRWKPFSHLNREGCGWRWMTESKVRPREGEGEIMSFGLRHDGSQFYHKTSCELLISRFSVTWNCKVPMKWYIIKISLTSHVLVIKQAQKNHFIRLLWGVIGIIFIKSLKYVEMHSVNGVLSILKGSESELV